MRGGVPRARDRDIDLSDDNRASRFRELVDALEIDPTAFSPDFEIVSAAVDVVADMPRLIRFVDLVRNSRVTGPLMGVSNIGFSLNGNESVATLQIVGVRFVSGSTGPTTTVPSEMTITP